MVKSNILFVMPCEEQDKESQSSSKGNLSWIFQIKYFENGLLVLREIVRSLINMAIVASRLMTLGPGGGGGGGFVRTK